MSLFDVPSMRWMTTDWFSVKTDAQIDLLVNKYGGNLKHITDYINTFFDAHIANRSQQVCVTLNCPDPWPAVLQPVWLAAWQDREQAAMFLGNLFCRVAISRPEKWASVPYPIFTHAEPRIYALASDMVVEMMK